MTLLVRHGVNHNRVAMAEDRGHIVPVHVMAFSPAAVLDPQVVIGATFFFVPGNSPKVAPTTDTTKDKIEIMTK